MGLIQNKVTVSQPNSHVVVKNAGGLRGLTGETGPQGPQGVPGEAATVTVGTTTTLPAGSDATVQNVGSTSAAIFNFGIPKGDKGDTGETGTAATISVGTTTTLEPGEDATVTNSGTSSAAVFDFGIPKGAKGDTGSQGPAGADGFSPTATVTKTGDTATITITDKDGTTTAQISDGVTPTIDPALSPTSENPVQNKVVTNALAGKADKPIIVSSLPATGTARQEYFVDDRYNTVTELKGDTQQTTYSGKNLYEGSPSFSSYNNISAWEDGGTYNGMPVVKRAAAWTGAYRLINIEAGATYTFSAWVKSDEARQVAIYAIGSGATATITPNNKNITTSTSWERVSFTFTCSTSGTIALRFENTSASTTNYTYISGYQLEKNSSMTSFEPYVGGTASPNPDYPQEVQTVTGEQTVTVVGKNLLDISTFAIGGMNAGTPAVYEQYRINNANSPIPVEPNGTYTLQASLGSTIKGLRVGIHSCDANGTFVSDSSWKQLASEPYTFTVGANIGYVKFVFSLSTTSSTVTMGGTENTTGGFASASEWLRGTTLQFEKGSNASQIIPFNKQVAQVNLGKNIVYAPDGTTSRNNVELAVSSGNIRIHNTGATSYVAFGVDNTLRNSNYGNYVAWGSTVLRAGTYTLSYTKVSGSTTTTGGGGNFLKALVYTRPIGDTGRLETIAATVELGDATNSATFTLEKDVQANVVVYLYATDATVDLTFNLQLERGSTATTYAPYFTPIELCKIGTYQDYIYKSGDNWYLHKETGKVTFTGAETETWSSVTAATGYVRFSTASGASHADNNGYCNELINRGSQSHGAYEYVWVQPNANAFYIQVLNTRANDLAGFRTWLGANPATVYYDISTPTDTQITDATLIAQLNALAGAKIMVDGGTATVTSQYLPATLTTAYNSNSGYIDYIYDGTNFVKVR